jgi:hypothetical protein
MWCTLARDEGLMLAYFSAAEKRGRPRAYGRGGIGLFLTRSCHTAASSTLAAAILRL